MSNETKWTKGDWPKGWMEPEAAAPMLFDALEAMLTRRGLADESERCRIDAQARAALAKARGES